MKYYIIILTTIFISGCSTIKKPELDMNENNLNIDKIKYNYQLQRESELNDGSINIDNDYSMLGDFKKSIRVGDSITIEIKENVSSQTNNNNIQNKSSSIGVSGGTITSGNAKTQSFLDKVINPYSSLGVNLSKENKFIGKADNSTRENFSASITGLITEKITNNLYKVEATKTLLINNEQKTLVLIGYVHTSNIGNDRLISSSKILNLKMEYRTAGDLSDTSRKGEIQRIMDKLF